MTANSTISPAVRVFLVAAVLLVFFSAISLFILSEQTEMYFAWTINPPLTAAFLGAGYASVALALGLALRERDWMRLRVGVSVVAVALVLILLATLLHLDRFHLNSSMITAQLWAWAWMILYIGLIPGLIFALWRQSRVKRGLVGRLSTLAPWLRSLMWILGAMMVIIGVGLVALPASVAVVWAWQLTPLTGRMIGAWFTSIGVSLFAATYENDYSRVYVIAVAYIAFAILQFVNLVRYPSSVNWSQPSIWLLIAVLTSMLVVGSMSLRGYLALARRSDRA